MKPAQARALAKLAPAAMRPSWMVKTWAGRYGAKSLEVSIKHADSTVHASSRGLTGSAAMEGVVRSTKGATVGTVERSLKLHPNGRLEVHHDFLELQSAAQGSGFSRAFNDRAFARYAGAGVDDVTVFAALDVGGYAWARQGFELAKDGVDELARMIARARRIRELVEHASRSDSITKDEHAELARRLIRSDGVLPQDALTSVQELASIPDLGRRVLLGQSWQGVRAIDHVSPWWSRVVAAGDAHAGASYLVSPDEAASGAQRMARSITARLPPAFDDVQAARVLERAAARFGHAPTELPDSSTSLSFGLRKGSDAIVGANRTSTLVAGDAQFTTSVSWSKSGKLQATEQFDGVDRRAARRIFNSTWRELGVNRVTDRDTRATRRIAD